MFHNPDRCNNAISVMVLWDVVVVISTTSGHFEWASITIKYILFWKGPVCTRCQGLLGHSQGRKGATAGEFFTD